MDERNERSVSLKGFIRLANKWTVIEKDFDCFSAHKLRVNHGWLIKRVYWVYPKLKKKIKLDYVYDPFLKGEKK